MPINVNRGHQWQAMSNVNQAQSSSSNFNQGVAMPVNVNQCQSRSSNVNKGQVLSIKVKQCQLR